VSLPTADDLFRPTADPADAPEAAPEGPGRLRSVGAEHGAQDRPGGADGTDGADGTAAAADADAAAPGPRRTSGRVRHDEKMTVYVTSDELLDLEHARLALRRDLGLAVDRGRLVREAITMALADLDERGGDSELVRRLRGEHGSSPN
jgi:hypothetical protein